MILAWVSAAFVAGIALGTTWNLPLAPELVLAGGLMVAAARLRRTGLAVPAVVLCAAILGVARAPHAHPSGQGDLAHYVGTNVTVSGLIDAEPDIRDTGANYEVRVDTLTLRGRRLRVSGALWIHTSRAVELEYGDAVAVTGTLVRPKFSPYRNATAEARFPRVIDTGPGSTGLLGWVVPLRRHLEDGIDRWLPEPEAALLIAITLGARSASLGDLAPALIATGLIHLIAISGIKVALVAGTMHALMRKVGNRQIALVGSLVVLYGYVLITGATISGFRSALMWSLVFVAAYLGRDTVALVSLGFAAALMLAHDPTLISDIGFQLTTVGTFCIVALAPTIQRWLRMLPSPFNEALATSVAAQIGTLPIVILGFHLVSAWGPIANALVLPTLPALIFLGFVIGAAASIAVVAAPLAALAYACLHAIVTLSTTLAALPGTFAVTELNTWFMVPYYALLVIVSTGLLRREQWTPAGGPRRTRREIAGTLAAACLILTGTAALARGDSPSSVYWLASGDAVLLKSGQLTALIGGSAKPFQLSQRLGERIPFDERVIDLVIVTDARTSTVTAYEGVLRHYAIAEVLDTGSEYPNGTYARWRTVLRTRGILAYALRTGASVAFGLDKIEGIAPDGPCSLPQDCAGIVRVVGRSTSILFAGSSSVVEQHETLFRNVDVRANILVCPTACDASFIRAVAPKVVFSTQAPPWSGVWKLLKAPVRISG